MSEEELIKQGEAATAANNELRELLKVLDAEEGPAKENLEKTGTDPLDFILGHEVTRLGQNLVDRNLKKQIAGATGSGIAQATNRGALTGARQLLNSTLGRVAPRILGGFAGMGAGPIGSLVGLAAPELVSQTYDALSDPEQEKYLDELSVQNAQDAQNAAKWNALNATTEGQSFIPPAAQAMGPFSPAANPLISNDRQTEEYNRIVGEAQAALKPAGFSDDEINAIILGENHYSPPASPASSLEHLPSPLLMDANATIPGMP